MSLIFSQEAIDLGPWSSSKKGTLETCPYKFELQYVLKLRKSDLKDVPVLDDSALRYGGSIHRSSEIVGKGGTLKQALKTTAEEQKLTVVEKKQLKAASQQILSFEDRICKFKDRYEIKEDFLEKDLGLDCDLKESSYWSSNTLLRGKLDRLLITEDRKTAVVIDLKTGRIPTLKYSKEQLEFYATLVMGNFPEVNTVRSALYFIRVGEMLWDKPRKRECYPMGKENAIAIAINKLAADFCAKETAEIKVNNGCKWCIYKNLCLKERKTRRS